MESIRLIHKWRQALWQILLLILVSCTLALSINRLRQEPLPLVGEWSATARMTTVSGERLDITLEEAVKLFRNKGAVFMDARSEAEYARGHIRGALNLPWQDVDRLFFSVTANLQTHTPMITYCDGQMCSQAHDLAVFLRNMGYVNVNVLVNGWTLWKEADLPVEKMSPVAG